MNRLTIFAVAGALMFAAPMTPASAQGGYGDCANRTDLQRQIEACTTMINQPDLPMTRKAGAYLYRCQAKDMAGDPAGALPDCLESEKLRSDDPSTYNSLNIVYLRLKRPADALAASNNAIRLAPNDGGYVNGRANAYCMMGNAEASYNDRLQALSMGRFTPDGLQRALQARGYYNGPIDGNFGDASKAALKRWTEAGCP